jgi:hypothetical protein
MGQVNEKAVTFRLREFLDRDDGWGSDEGEEVRERLARAIDAHPDSPIVRITLEGTRTDASFARASVVELAFRYRARHGICVTGFESEDILENWDMAALKRGQGLIAWTSKGPRLLGPQPSNDTRALLQLVFQRGVVSTAEAAKVLKKEVNNVSTRLKRLYEEGLIFRSEATAPSGGVEYRYLAIR